MGDYELYQAVKSFTPSSDDEQEFQKGDVFEISIQSPFETSQSYRPGWLFAYNRRTRRVGNVPVECVKLLGSEVGKTIHHPSACGVEVSNSKPEMEIKPEHKLEDAFFLTPILCKHCKDYIWGQGHVGVKCKVHLERGRCEECGEDVQLVDGSNLHHLDAGETFPSGKYQHKLRQIWSSELSGKNKNAATDRLSGLKSKTEGFIMACQDAGETYTYLGVVQYRSQEVPTVKNSLRGKYQHILRQIWSAELSGKNKVAATNMLAVPILLYSFGGFERSCDNST